MPPGSPAPTGCPNRPTWPTCKPGLPPKTCSAHWPSPPVARFKPELVCIVDTLDRSILVYRSEKHALILPPCRLFNWAKSFFEWLYLKPYRKTAGA